jgi:Ca2+-transporting ATPase
VTKSVKRVPPRFLRICTLRNITTCCENSRQCKGDQSSQNPIAACYEIPGRKTGFRGTIFSITIPILGILREQDAKTMILTGLSLASATIPEELPIIITMVLRLGAYTLSRNKFLVKRIKAAETLGNVTG